MCFTISITTSSEAQLAKALGPSFPKSSPKLLPRYVASGFTHPDWPVIAAENPAEFDIMNWGLIPSWTPHADLAGTFRNNNLNAKSETVFEKKSFHQSIFKRRCLIPVTGFFEWHSRGKIKYPYHIQLQNEEVFLLGGIYDFWEDQKTGKSISTFSILTTEANSLMAQIHNSRKRMPLIFTQEMSNDWLLPDLSEKDIRSLMLPFPDDKMTAYTISKLISSRTQNSDVPEALLPHQYAELESPNLLF